MQGIFSDSPLWFDGTVDEDENYGDDYEPVDFGHIRPCVYEWGDYIVDEQQHYLAGVGCGEIELSAPKNKHRYTLEEICEILAKYDKLSKQMTHEMALWECGLSHSSLTRWRKMLNINTNKGETK